MDIQSPRNFMVIVHVVLRMICLRRWKGCSLLCREVCLEAWHSIHEAKCHQ